MTSLESQLKAENKALKDSVRYLEGILKVAQSNAKKANAAIQVSYLEGWGDCHASKFIQSNLSRPQELLKHQYLERYMNTPLLSEVV